MFGPQPRSYDYQLPKKVERGALRAALAQKLKDGQLVVVDALAASEIKTKAAVGAAEDARRRPARRCSIDVAPDEKLARSVRNLPGVALVPSGRVTARDVANATAWSRRAGAIEKLQEALAIMKLTDVIRRPLITEKTSHPARRRPDDRVRGGDRRQQDPDQAGRREAARLEGRRASARASRTARSSGRDASPDSGPDWKKAYVTLREGQKMPEFLEGA